MERLIIKTEYGARFHVMVTKEEADQYVKIKKDNPKLTDEEALKKVSRSKEVRT